MKKITFVLSAVLVALTLNAQELRLKEVVASRAADVFAPMSTITLEKGNAVLDKQAALSMKKAPAVAQQTQSTCQILAMMADQTSISGGAFAWLASTDTAWAAQRFAVSVYPMINDSTLGDRLAFFNQGSNVFGAQPYSADSSVYFLQYTTSSLLYYVASGYGTADSAGYADYVYGTYNNNLIYGSYYIYIRGNDGAAWNSAGKGVVLTINSFDITGFDLNVDEDNMKATVKWDELTLPEGYYYAVDIAAGSESVWSNYSTLTSDSVVLAHSPITFNIEKGKTYSVYINVLELYNGKLYLGCDNWIDTSFTVGVNYYEPKNLQANVLAGEYAGYVELAWEADSASYAYYLQLYDETGAAISFGNYKYLIAYNTKDTIGLGAGKYYWVVAGLERGADGYLNLSTDQIQGPSFTMPDVRAPQLANAQATVDAETYTSAVITVMSADDGTAQEDIVIELQDSLGAKVSQFTYLSGYNYADTLVNLEAGKEYTYYISAKDLAGNVTPAADRLVVSFTTADVKAPTVMTPSTSNITSTSVKITVRATDNVSKDKLVVIVTSDSLGLNKIADLALESTLKYSGVVEDLTPETAYNLFISATDEAGNITIVAVPAFTTLPAENEAPVIGEITVVPDATSAVVSFVVSDDKTAADKLVVSIQDTAQAEVAYPEYNAEKKLFEVTIDQLEEGTDYTFVVVAIDEGDLSAIKQFSFTTTTTGLDDIRTKGNAVKVIENGQIYILRGSEKFNVLGAKVED